MGSPSRANSSGANSGGPGRVLPGYQRLDCYYTRSIWLRKDTRKVVDAYAQVSKDFLNKVSLEMNRSGYLANGTSAMELLNSKLELPLSEVEEKLRVELNIPRPWWQMLIREHRSFVYHG